MRRALSVFTVMIALTLAALAPARALSQEAAQPTRATAVFAGGCFWCTEADFDKVPGVLNAVSGYTGGSTLNPTYREVTRDVGGHYEAVEVTYDPTVVSYDTLVEYFWRTIDPTDPHGQFCDKGLSYRSAIFVANDAERAIAEASRDGLLDAGRLDRIVTAIVPSAPFWPAEAYHQDYAKTNVLAYRAYRTGCGRDRRLRQLWGDEAGGGSILEAAQSPAG